MGNEDTFLLTRQVHQNYLVQQDHVSGQIFNFLVSSGLGNEPVTLGLRDLSENLLGRSFEQEFWFYDKQGHTLQGKFFQHYFLFSPVFLNKTPA